MCIYYHEIVPGKPWSMCQLQQALQLRWLTTKSESQGKASVEVARMPA